jgi:hypothetical protein
MYEELKPCRKEHIIRPADLELLQVHESYR